MAADNTRIDGTHTRLWRRSRNVADFLRPPGVLRTAFLRTFLRTAFSTVGQCHPPFPKRDFHGTNAIRAHFRPKKSYRMVSARRPLVSAQHFFVSARRPLVSARHQLVSAQRPLVSAQHQLVSAQHALTSGQDRHGTGTDCGHSPITPPSDLQRPRRGRRNLATGGAGASPAQPVERVSSISRPVGAKDARSTVGVQQPAFRRPSRGGLLNTTSLHGFRCAPPVATPRRPVGTRRPRVRPHANCVFRWDRVVVTLNGSFEALYEHAD